MGLSREHGRGLSADGTAPPPLRKRIVQGALLRAGYQLQRVYPRDYPGDVVEIIERVKPYTMTSPARIADTCFSVDYVTKHELPGAIVECGVWRGGSTMAMALRLLSHGAGDRDLYLFDTFAGMAEPGEEDVARDGFDAARTWAAGRRGDENAWGYADIEDVRRAIESTGYEADRMHLVKGMVETTLPAQAPESITLLRLDTDFYSSTKHELEHLFPRLVTGGVLILDDYGYWGGARRAADEYFEAHGVRILLHRTDATGRVGVKQ